MFAKGMIADPGGDYIIMWATGVEGDRFYPHIFCEPCVDEGGCVPLTKEEVLKLIKDKRYPNWWALKAENLERCLNMIEVTIRANS